MSSVQEIMTKNPACCTPDMKITDVAELMLSFDCGEIPVIYNYTEKKVVGVITDRDICIRIVAQGFNPKLFTVEDCMSSPAIVVEETMSIDECCRIMEENQIRRIPVVDLKGNCVGMLSLADVAKYSEEKFSTELIRQVSRPSSDSPTYVS